MFPTESGHNQLPFCLSTLDLQVLWGSSFRRGSHLLTGLNCQSSGRPSLEITVTRGPSAQQLSTQRVTLRFRSDSWSPFSKDQHVCLQLRKCRCQGVRWFPTAAPLSSSSNSVPRESGVWGRDPVLQYTVIRLGPRFPAQEQHLPEPERQQVVLHQHQVHLSQAPRL
ncbi:hypothetical protein GN956_G8407 [Arapaima gigas]